MLFIMALSTSPDLPSTYQYQCQFVIGIKYFNVHFDMQNFTYTIFKNLF